MIDEKYQPTEYELQLRATATAIRDAANFPDAVAILSMFVREGRLVNGLPEPGDDPCPKCGKPLLHCVAGEYCSDEVCS